MKSITSPALNVNIPEKALYLLPLLPVVFFFAHSFSRFTELILTKEVLLLFFIYTTASYLLFALLRFIFRLPLPVSFCSCVLLTTGFLFFGALQDMLFLSGRLHFLSNSFVLLSVILASVSVLIVIFKRNKSPLFKTNRYLLVLFSLFILYEAAAAGLVFIMGKNANNIARNMTTPLPLPDKNTQAENAPDIYYILFDAYTSRRALKQYWNFDNDIWPFLEEKGFFTLDSAFSNYTSTPFSVSSIFNMQYLKGAEPYLHSNSSNFLIGRKTYLNNILFEFLKKRGYDFSVYSQLEDQELLTTFGFLGVEKPVNWLRKLTAERIWLNPWIQEKFSRIFNRPGKEPSMIRKSMASFRKYNASAISHLLMPCTDSLKQKNGKPLFSFTHLMLPHDPYQVDENGNFIPSAKPGGGDMNGYLQQVKYSNKLIREAITCLLSDTVKKKIIIIQGDHGYRHNAGAPAERQYDALHAVYFYNKDYAGMNKQMSHVNTFRTVINKFFGGNLSLLKDSIKMLNRKNIEAAAEPY